jgi:hypothetical protein
MLVASGCKKESECQLQDEIAAINAAMTALEERSDTIKTEIAEACSAIIGNEEPPEELTTESIATECTAAARAIRARFEDAAGAVVVFEPGRCAYGTTFAAAEGAEPQTQFQCEARCYGEARCECEPETFERRCDEAAWSGKCDGNCKGNCIAEPERSVECAALCVGTCNGICEGVCEGECAAPCKNPDGGVCPECLANCVGKCDGDCNGRCSGTCVTTGRGDECSGECKGECSEPLDVRACDEMLRAPRCDCDNAAACLDACRGSALLAALDTCAQPSLTIAGALDEEYVGVLEEHLLVLLELDARTTELFEAASAIESASSGLVDKIGDAPACNSLAGADFADRSDATADLAASLHELLRLSEQVVASAQSGG